ncbi:MAG: HPr(Ser) kinase/phosphatase [Acidobacteria bacterium]|nr:HPr(Ser) kinase/phosphatase [Acidobacteriota bacterium]
MVSVQNQERVISVRELLQHPFKRIEPVLVAGQKGLENRITSARIQKLGLALGGYTGYIHPGRIQFVGGTENHFLQTMGEDQRSAAFQNLQSQPICCIMFTRGLDHLPPDLCDLCDRRSIPLLSVSAVSSVAIAEVTGFLEQVLAPEISLHGVLMDVYGLGVFLCGESGLGKSECALDLIIRGHRLVSDDLVCIMRRGRDTLVGRGPENFQFHMELRGLGIIDIKELFGISVLRQEKTIELAIRFEAWSKETNFDRLGWEEESMEILDVHLPLLRMPVAPGRNLATLVEVAARLQLLKARGKFESAGE